MSLDTDAGVNRATAQTKTALLVIPSFLIARNLLKSSFLTEAASQGMRFTVVSPGPEDGKYLQDSGLADWKHYFHPLRANPGRSRLAMRWDRFRYLAGLFLHMQLIYRFNRIAGFGGFRQKLQQSWNLRRMYLREGQPMSRLFGLPFPLSPLLFRLLKRAYYSGWQRFRAVDGLIDEVRPDLIVIAQLQTHVVTPYVLAGRAKGIPLVGVNGSWDQPTTKGPLCPWLGRVFTQNGVVKDELEKYHSLPRDKIETVGWLQMDRYPEAAAKASARDAFLAKMRFPPDARYILFALNTPRLGVHEPEIAQAIAERLAHGEFGEDVYLVLRCHPLDTTWQARWGAYCSRPRVFLQPPEMESFDLLIESIHHSHGVIGSAGSVLLDALALERPAIALAWEDERCPYHDRPARAYEMEHLKSLLSSGMRIARGTGELIEAVHACLSSEQRTETESMRRLRRLYFGQLDGMAARRLATGIARHLHALQNPVRQGSGG